MKMAGFAPAILFLTGAATGLPGLFHIALAIAKEFE